MPLTVKVPWPFFTSAPPAPLRTPLKAVEVPLPPVVSVRALSVALPVPARLPIVSLLSRFSVPGAVTVTETVSSIAAPFCRLSVPAFTFTGPVKVFAPLRVWVPMPTLVSESRPVPFRMTPE